MKYVMGWWLATMALLSAGGLTFPEIKKEVTPDLSATSAVVDYPFTNKTDKVLRIKSATAACSCVTVSISGGKTSYEPGESGTIRATYDYGTAWGELEKDILIYLEGDAEAAPSSDLKLTVKIPVLVEIEPKTARWEMGDKQEPKKIQIRMKGEKPIRITSISPSTENFKQELKTIEEGKTYEVVITPNTTEKFMMSVIRLETDCEIKAHATQQVFAMVQRKQAAPANPAK